MVEDANVLSQDSRLSFYAYHTYIPSTQLCISFRIVVNDKGQQTLSIMPALESPETPAPLRLAAGNSGSRHNAQQLGCHEL
jgi:hypothetical protein